MATELYNKIKDFNTPAIRREVAALGILLTAKFSGFQSGRDLNRLEPFPEATRVITRTRQPDGSILEDTAARGDVRIETRNPLTAPEVASIDTVLDDHDATIDDPTQADARQNLDDIASLRALFDAGIADPTLNLTVTLVLRDAGEDV